MYHICTISDILRQGVDSLAQWLEHWISTPAVRVRIPSGTWDFFQAMHHFLVTNFHIRKKGHSRVMIYIKFVELQSLMLHTKFQNHWPSGSGEEDF